LSRFAEVTDLVTVEIESEKGVLVVRPKSAYISET
jgi:hypothetical protein